VNIRNFPKGRGIVLEPGRAGIDVGGVTQNCGEHLVAENQRGTDLRLNMIVGEGETYTANTSPLDNFALRILQA